MSRITLMSKTIPIRGIQVSLSYASVVLLFLYIVQDKWPANTKENAKTKDGQGAAGGREELGSHSCSHGLILLMTLSAISVIDSQMFHDAFDGTSTSFSLNY